MVDLNIEASVLDDLQLNLYKSYTPLHKYGCYHNIWYQAMVELFLKDSPNRGRSVFDLSNKDKHYGPHKTIKP